MSNFDHNFKHTQIINADNSVSWPGPLQSSTQWLPGPLQSSTQWLHFHSNDFLVVRQTGPLGSMCCWARRTSCYTTTLQRIDTLLEDTPTTTVDNNSATWLFNTLQLETETLLRRQSEHHQFLTPGYRESDNTAQHSDLSTRFLESSDRLSINCLCSTCFLAPTTFTWKLSNTPTTEQRLSGLACTFYPMGKTSWVKLGKTG